VALIQEPDLKTAAERLAITEGTARIYLKQVFEKTGVNSQVALMKLLLTGPAILGK
jgi:DNA-binding CsgD family transcriptional regulator